MEVVTKLSRRLEKGCLQMLFVHLCSRHPQRMKMEPSQKLAKKLRSRLSGPRNQCKFFNSLFFLFVASSCSKTIARILGIKLV